MIGDPTVGLLAGSRYWLLVEWSLLAWQAKRDLTAVRELMEKLAALQYQLILLISPQDLTDLEALTEQVQRVLPRQLSRPILLVEKLEPNTKLKLEASTDGALPQVAIKCSQSIPNNIVSACQQLLRKSSIRRSHLSALVRNYGVAYWMKAGFFRSFYFSERHQEQMLEVLQKIIEHTGQEDSDDQSPKKEKKDENVSPPEPTYDIDALDIRGMTTEPLDAAQHKGTYTSRWLLKDPQSGKSYEAHAKVVMANKEVDTGLPKKDALNAFLSNWLYHLMGVETQQVWTADIPVNPKVPLHNLVTLKPKEAPPVYKPITHILHEVDMDKAVPFSACKEYASNIGDSSALNDGIFTIDGVKSVPREFGRLVCMVHVFSDEQFFNNIGSAMCIKSEKEATRVVKRSTTLNFERITQRLNKQDKYEDPKSIGTEKCHLNLLMVSKEFKQSFYMGLSNLRAAYLSDVFAHPKVAAIFKELALTYNRILETRLKLMETTLKEYIDNVGTPNFPLESSKFDLRPSLFVESVPLAYDNLRQLKQRVVLFHADSEDLLDQVLSEIARIFGKVEHFQCRGKSDQQIKDGFEKLHPSFKEGECVVLVRNYHRIDQLYKMNIYHECGLAAYPHVQLVIACPSRYLVHNYQTWFRPHPKSPDSMIEIRIGAIPKAELARMVGRHIEEPLRYLDMLYDNTSLADLLSSPYIFNSAVSLIERLPLKDRVHNGLDLFNRMLEDWLNELRGRALSPLLEKQLLELLHQLSLNTLLRGKYIAPLPSADMWEMLNRSSHQAFVEMQQHTGISLAKNNTPFFLVADFLLKEVWKDESDFNEASELFKLTLIRKIVRQNVSDEDKKKLLQRILKSKHETYFQPKVSALSGLAISMLHACSYNLTNLDLSLTELPHASLHGCNLANTKLRGTNLSRADLTKSYCLNSGLDLSRLQLTYKLSEIQSISVKSIVTDIAVVRDHHLLINLGGLVEKVEWEKLTPIVHYNLPTGQVRIMRATSGFVVTVKEASEVEVYDLESGTKIKDFDTGINYIEYVQLIQSYAVLGRRSVELEIWDYYKAVKVRRVIWKAIISALTSFGSRNILIGDERGVVSSLVVPDNTIEVNFKAHDAEVHCIRSQESRIITAAEDRTVKIWRLAAGSTILFRQIRCGDSIMGLFGSRSNDFIVITGIDSATLYNQNLDKLARYYKAGCKVNSACIDEKLRRLYISTSQGISMVEYQILHQQAIGHSCSVTVCIADDYFNRIITGGLDSNIIVWNSLTCQLQKKLLGHTEGITCMKMVGYDVVISGSYDFTLRLWSIQDGRCLAVISDHLARIIDLAFNHRSKILFSGSGDGQVRVWRLNKLETALKLAKTFQEHKKPVLKLACTSQSSLFVSAGEDRRIIVYGEDVKYCETILKYPVTSMVVIAEDRCLCCCIDGSMVTVDMTKAQILNQVRLQTGLVLYHYIEPLKLFVSAQGNCIVLHTQDKVLYKVIAHPQTVNYLAYSPHNGTVVTACSDCSVGVWVHDSESSTLRLNKIMDGESLMDSIVSSQ